MAAIGYRDLAFEETKDAVGKEVVRCTLFSRYWFDLDKAELERIGPVTVSRDTLDFPEASEKRVLNKTVPLLEEGLTWRLRHKLYDKPAFYIREDLGIPLIGSTEIGVTDRGSNIIEVKPLTGCNFTCTYCSVDEGKNDKSYDYLVEADCLVAAAAELAKAKTHPVEFNIGPHGEPTLYPQLLELVRRLRAIPNCGVISMNTNGSLLSERLIDDLAAAGMTRVNLSIPAMNEQLAAELAGVRKFPLQHLLDMLAYGKGKMAFLLAPVLIPGKNEDEMERIVELSKTITSDFPTVGVQNYLSYPKGRRPVKRPMEWERFYAFLDKLERATGKGLRSTMEEFRIFEEREPAKPFRKGQTVECTVCMPGRYPHEMYAQAQGRLINIQVPNDLHMIGKRIKARIVRDKHNIYKATKA